MSSHTGEAVPEGLYRILGQETRRNRLLYTGHHQHQLATETQRTSQLPADAEAGRNNIRCSLFVPTFLQESSQRRVVLPVQDQEIHADFSRQVERGVVVRKPAVYRRRRGHQYLYLWVEAPC